MGKVSFTRDIGDKQESFDIKITEQCDDVEIRDTYGNVAFPTPQLIKELHKEIIRLEIASNLIGSGRGGLFTLEDLAKRYGIKASQVGRYLKVHEIFEDEKDGALMLFYYEKVLRIDVERGFKNKKWKSWKCPACSDKCVDPEDIQATLCHNGHAVHLGDLREDGSCMAMLQKRGDK